MNTAMGAWIGLGANLGDAAASIGRALDAIDSLAATRIERVSSLYRSDPVDAQGPDFFNAVAEVETTLSPAALLERLLAIEAAEGRLRPYRNAPRTLDLDLLLYGDETRATPRLVLPHPRMHERAFVLLPLVEIAPDAVIPGHGPAAALTERVREQKLAKLAIIPASPTETVER